MNYIRQSFVVDAPNPLTNFVLGYLAELGCGSWSGSSLESGRDFEASMASQEGLWEETPCGKPFARGEGIHAAGTLLGEQVPYEQEGLEGEEVTRLKQMYGDKVLYADDEESFQHQERLGLEEKPSGVEEGEGQFEEEARYGEGSSQQFGDLRPRGRASRGQCHGAEKGMAIDGFEGPTSTIMDKFFEDARGGSRQPYQFPPDETRSAPTCFGSEGPSWLSQRRSNESLRTRVYPKRRKHPKFEPVRRHRKTSLSVPKLFKERPPYDILFANSNVDTVSETNICKAQEKFYDDLCFQHGHTPAKEEVGEVEDGWQSQASRRSEPFR